MPDTCPSTCALDHGTGSDLMCGAYSAAPGGWSGVCTRPSRHCGPCRMRHPRDVAIRWPAVSLARSTVLKIG